jgi:hypothetical protein
VASRAVELVASMAVAAADSTVVAADTVVAAVDVGKSR